MNRLAYYLKDKLEKLIFLRYRTVPIPNFSRLFTFLRSLPMATRKHFALRFSSLELDSQSLGRKVLVDIYAPKQGGSTPLPLVCFNDGQDIRQMSLQERLSKWWSEGELPRFILVGIHANKRRIREYGTAGQADYAKRGDLAPKHEAFVLQELLPYLEENYSISHKASQRAFAGFSLGGLSALDLVWRNPKQFGIVGVFSGSLWWRSEAFDKEEPDANRIIHTQFTQEDMRPGLRFWFQAGTADETSDRNKNGVIDAIDDTLDLVAILKEKGYQTEQDIKYLEVEGGRHEPATWSEVLPAFLRWAFGKR